MKKLLLLFVSAIALSSCAVHNPGSTSINYVDFEQFRSMGVSISSTLYSGDVRNYTQLGEISVMIKPEVKSVRKPKSSSDRTVDPLYGPGKGGWSVETQEIELDDAIMEMVAEVKRRGGNAIFNFNHFTEWERDSSGNPIRKVIVVSGYAAKKLQ